MDEQLVWETNNNKEFIQKYFSGLFFVNQFELRGVISLCASHNGQTIILNPEHNESAIKFEYGIKIILPREKRQFPIVYMLGSKIEKSATKWNIRNLIDMHTYTTGQAFLCSMPVLLKMINDGFTLEELINGLIVPYYYQQVFFDRNGIWPFKNYSHRSASVFEYYYDQYNNKGFVQENFVLCLESLAQIEEFKRSTLIFKALTSASDLKSHSKCFCNSNRKYKKCCRKKISSRVSSGLELFKKHLKTQSKEYLLEKIVKD